VTGLLRTAYDGPRGPRLAVCDRRCDKAWGVNGRRADNASSIEFDQDDDIVYLADGETGTAPRDPGTYEGGQAKPFHPDRHNKWCLRECERCSVVEAGEAIRIHDFAHRQYNQPWKHDGAVEAWIETGETYRP